MPRTVVAAILSAAFAVMISTGVRQSFGLFLAPISDELGGGREAFSLAVALSNLIYGLPIIGILVDRFGSRRVLGVGGVVYAAGLLLITQWVSVWGLILSLGVLAGMGLGATTYVVVLGAIGRLVDDDHRSKVFGVITAMGSAGFLIMPPLNQWWLERWGWKAALGIGAALAASIAFLALGLPRRDRGAAVPNPLQEAQAPWLAFITQGFRQPSFLLLVAGFFVCGFHVAFIGVHLPVFLSDHGIGHIRGLALALIGTFNLVGSLSFGWLGDRLPRRYLLSFIYGGRGAVIALYFFLPVTVTSSVLFSALIGLLWLATVPLTSGAVATFFGTRYLATMYGFVFFSHQIGAFLGSWWAGRLYDQLGSYDLIFYMSIALGLFGFLIHLPIKERPFRIQLAPARAA